jgi:hypothetical protein
MTKWTVDSKESSGQIKKGMVPGLRSLKRERRGEREN